MPMAAAALSRAALASARPLINRDATATAPRAMPAIPRCLKSAIKGKRSAELPRRLAAVQPSSSSTSTSTPPSSSSPPPPPLPPPQQQQQRKHPLEAEASELRRALSNRGGASGATPDRALLDRARDLALSLAAATRVGGGAGKAAVSPEAAAFLDALAGAVTRGLEQQQTGSPSSSFSPSFGPSPSASPPSSIASLEGSARLLRAFAQAGHRSLAASELARAVVRQACRALTAAESLAPLPPSSRSPPPPVPVFAAAAAIARSLTLLGIYPGARLMEALSASVVAFSETRRRSGSGGSSGGPSFSISGSATSTTDSDGGGDETGSSPPPPPPRLPSRLPASAVVDWLCAAASARHVLPPAVAALAATARFNPIQAAAAAAALASLGSGSDSSPSSPPPPLPLFPALVSTLRSRVAGSPRGGVPPRAAVAAAWALASWKQLDAASAAALAEHAEAGIASSEASSLSSSASVSNNSSVLGGADLVSLWGALRAAGWRAAEAKEEAAAAFPAVSARAARAASAARAAAVAAASEEASRGPPAELSKLSERLKLMLKGKRASVAVVAPKADEGSLLWSVEVEVEESLVAIVALSPPENASSNSPVVALGLASVELNAAGELFCFRGLLSAGAGDDELEAVAAAVEEALLLRRTAGAAAASQQPSSSSYSSLSVGVI